MQRDTYMMIKGVPSGGVGGVSDMDSAPESLRNRDLYMYRECWTPLPSGGPCSAMLLWELVALSFLTGRLSRLSVFVRASCNMEVRVSSWSSTAWSLLALHIKYKSLKFSKNI